jgi:hypothetical protein
MQVVSERPIVKSGNISVTSLRVTIGAKTYAMSSIASVRIQENEPRFFLPVFFMLIAGICFALVAASDMDQLSHFLTWGLYLSIAAFFLFLLSQTTKYSVRIRLIGSVEELNLLETSNRAQAEEVVQSIREAITQRE